MFLRTYAPAEETVCWPSGDVCLVRVTRTRVSSMPAIYPVSDPEEFNSEPLGMLQDHPEDVFDSKAFAGKRKQDRKRP